MNRVVQSALAACALSGCVLSGCSNTLTRRAPAPSSDTVADSVLVARVNHALRAAEVDGYATVQITAAGGAVTLEGTLATTTLVDLAIRTAEEVDGVERVTNRLVATGGTR